jgi:sulfite oxidase
LEEFEKRGIPFGPITVPLAFPSQTWEDYGDFWKKHGPRDAEDDRDGCRKWLEIE